MKQVSRAVGLRRLLKLADLLESLPRKRFDYTTWVGDDWKGMPDLSCGTTACALGWATTIRSFGLQLVYDQDFDGRYAYVAPKAMTPEWDGYSLGAAEIAFCLHTAEAEYLFDPSEGEDDATPKYVAKKIRRFVANAKKAA